MQKIGYSLIDSSNNEIQYWGNTYGQDVSIPNPIIIPNDITIYAPVVGESVGQYKLVERWMEANTELEQFCIGQTKLYDGTKLIVTQIYRNPTYKELLDYSASKRYNKEISGVKIGNNFVYTDRQSQAMITGIAALMQINSNTVIDFKTANGFIQANSTVIADISFGVANHIQTCFSLESTVSAGILSGNIINLDQINNVYE